MTILHIVWVWLSVWGGALLQQEYCPKWDSELNELITNAKKVRVGPNTTEIDGVSLWTSNKYYSYGHIWGIGGEHYRPSIKTMLRLNEFVNFHKYQGEK